MFHAGWLTLVLVTSAAHAQESVDLTLLLAVDVSQSISEREYEVMHQGYVAALRDPTTWAAVERCLPGGMALGYAEWSDRRNRPHDDDFMVEPFVRIASAGALNAFADRLEGDPRAYHGIFTDTAGALVDSVSAVEAAPFTAERRVVDVGTDGPPSNSHPDGFDAPEAWLAFARGEAIARDVTINALVLDRWGGVLNSGGDLEDYFKRFVVGGRDAFTMSIRKVEDVRAALVRKLRREICAVGT